MDIEELQNKNSHIQIKAINDQEFKKFGRIVDEIDFGVFVNYMVKYTTIPKEGNIYVASDIKMELYKESEIIKNEFYGEMPIEIGYCNGNNSFLNGLEYHKASEIDCAVTDIILLLGKIEDIENGSYDSSKIEAFFVPAGYAVELYATTLHYSPCKVNSEGFKCLVILPKGTNSPLKNEGKTKGEASLLFSTNKWLLVHPSRIIQIQNGAHIGITGENIKINI